LTKFDSSTGEKGILLGDSTLRGIQDQLYNALTAAIPQGGRFRVLADIGLKIVDGAKLEFDPDKFKEAYATDPDSITKFFTYLETTTDPVTNKTTSTGKGMAYLLESKITNLIDPVTGLITRENKTLDGRTTQFQQRIDTLDKLLDQKKLRLQKQFANMESVLASLQSQQSSLGALQNLATMNSSNKN
jgi:flagellar hook-associated protein 2